MRQKTIERYIEIIYSLEKKEGIAQTGMISNELGITPPSVTEMLYKLQKKGLVTYETYTGASLTPSGKAMACELMKKHKIVAEFLKIIDVDKKSAEIDACQIEHYVSDKNVEQLERFVNFLQTLPCQPIWIDYFKKYCKTGSEYSCNFCKQATKKKNSSM